MSTVIRTLSREPLLHFFVAAAGLFLLFHVVSDRNTVHDNHIVVSAGQITHIRSLFQTSRQRLPSDDELRDLIGEYINEEVLYREALAIGFDKDDTIIRRRLRQKMEFLLDDFVDAVPTDTDLRRFLAANPGRFRTDARISFVQVFLNANSSAKIEALLVDLRREETTDAASVSESHLIPHRFKDARRSEVTSRLGDEFTAAVFALHVGKWMGPIDSPFGIHLVRVEKTAAGRVPELTEIRDDVAREWLFDSRSAMQQQVLSKMKAKYAITIENYQTKEQ